MAYALITGASKGIGLAIAEQLARRKFDLLLVARSEVAIPGSCYPVAASMALKPSYYAIDLAKPGAAQRVFDWCQPKKYDIPMLVNNAGYGLSGPFEKHSLAEHTNMMAVNMTTLVELTYLFLPQLRQQPKAYILKHWQFSSVSGRARFKFIFGLKIVCSSVQSGIASGVKTLVCIRYLCLSRLLPIPTLSTGRRSARKAEKRPKR